MIEKIQLLRNVGQFDSVDPSRFDLTKLTMIYAENGRGKTTLAAILRSAGNGDGSLVTERRRLTAQHLPHVVLRDPAGTAVFQNGAWSRVMPEIIVFDDLFVAENVCSGVEIEAGHRQKLHELILGSQGVTLNTTVQTHIDAVEAHTKRIKQLGDAIPAAARGRLTVDSFCALADRPDIDNTIEQAERGLAAARAADPVRTQALFQPITLPAFDTRAINDVLGRNLAELEAGAAAQVQAHMRRLGKGGEGWIAEGMPRISAASSDSAHPVCPFCAQDLSGSALIAHYQAYFSQSYEVLKKAIVDQGKSIGNSHEGDVPAAFERDVRIAAQTREFWSRFAAMPDLVLDTADIGRAWKAAREGVLTTLRAKHAAPLERMQLHPSVIEAVDSYHRHVEAVARQSATLQEANNAVDLIKEQTATANVTTLEAELAGLQAVKVRHSTAVATACQAYLDEKAAKTTSEQARDRARTALDQYRTTIFPTYQNAINDYLRRFGASFRLDSVTSVNNRGGSSCTYNVLINAVPVPVTATTGPSFRNTMSAGDRNTLALAFFFASLERDANLARKVVIIDDPMTSLDEHRNRNTLQELRLLLDRVEQMIVLSHSKSFLCPLWQAASPTVRYALRIDRVRDGQNQDASTITEWNVHSDCVTEHDRRHEQVFAYIQHSDPAQERVVAAALRPILEMFVRVSYPGVFQPGDMLGQFLNLCRQRRGTAREILNAADIQELAYILDYANLFHHENPGYQTVLINDQQLMDFCQRTVTFARRP